MQWHTHSNTHSHARAFKSKGGRLHGSTWSVCRRRRRLYSSFACTEKTAVTIFLFSNVFFPYHTFSLAFPPIKDTRKLMLICIRYLTNRLPTGTTLDMLPIESEHVHEQKLLKKPPKTRLNTRRGGQMWGQRSGLWVLAKCGRISEATIVKMPLFFYMTSVPAISFISTWNSLCCESYRNKEKEPSARKVRDTTHSPDICDSSQPVRLSVSQSVSPSVSTFSEDMK